MAGDKPQAPDHKPGVDATPIAALSKSGHEAKLVPTGMDGDNIKYTKDDASFNQTRNKILGLHRPADFQRLKAQMAKATLPNGKIDNGVLAKMAPQPAHSSNMQTLKNQAETKALLDELDSAPREKAVATGAAKHVVPQNQKPKQWAMINPAPGMNA